jgi:hypothetical protein
VVALDLDRLQFLRLDLDIFAFAELITASLLVGLDDITRLGVHHLLLQPVAGLLVDHVKSGLRNGGRGRVQPNRACHQGQL